LAVRPSAPKSLAYASGCDNSLSFRPIHRPELRIAQLQKPRSGLPAAWPVELICSDTAAKNSGKNARGGLCLPRTRGNIRARPRFSQGRVSISYCVQTSQINSGNHQKAGFSRVARRECRCRKLLRRHDDVEPVAIVLLPLSGSRKLPTVKC